MPTKKGIIVILPSNIEKMLRIIWKNNWKLPVYFSNKPETLELNAFNDFTVVFCIPNSVPYHYKIAACAIIKKQAINDDIHLIVEKGFPFPKKIKRNVHAVDESSLPLEILQVIAEISMAKLQA